MENRMYLEQVPIKMIKPNPLNPRKDHGKNSELLQEIIKSKGWETAITCYENEGNYIILSGHRRWYAATQMGMNTIQVFVVEAPKDKLEELERLGSAQAGQKDWSVYEWAKFTFELWTMKKCTYRELALIMNKSVHTIQDHMDVFRYYPHHEIEKPLEEGSISMSILVRIMHWTQRVRNLHPDVFEELGETFIRNSMVRKAEKKKFTLDEIKKYDFLQRANPDQVLNFLRNTKKSLKEAYKETGSDLNQGKNSRTGVGFVLKNLENRKLEIQSIDVEVSDSHEIVDDLLLLKETIAAKRKEIETVMKDKKIKRRGS